MYGTCTCNFKKLKEKLTHPNLTCEALCMEYYQSTSCHFSHTKPLAHAAFWFSTLALLFHANRSLVGYETKVNSKYAVKISMCTTLENFW